MLSREDAEEFLKESVARLHQNGWFVSGQIRLIDHQRCPACDAETVWIEPEHRCGQCGITVRFQAERLQYANLIGPLKKRINELTDVILSGQIEVRPKAAADEIKSELQKSFNGSTGLCADCGSVTIPNGRCMKCVNCGSTTGCG